jgi:hypothetical protein
VATEVHDFRERLGYSDRPGAQDAWERYFRRVWPDLLQCVVIEGANSWQWDGVDRLLLFPNRKEIAIDCKEREGTFADVLLEEWSVAEYDRDTRRVLSGQKIGWAFDPSKVCDYVAYATPEINRCLLLPFEPLRAACERNREQWKRRADWYPKAARNRTYWTINFAIPWPILRDALAAEMLGPFTVA